MASIERDDIERALSKKGWQLQPGNDHRYYRLLVGGKATKYMTKVSTGKKYKTLGNDLVSAMAHQMALTSKELNQFVDCSISGADYVRLLRERNKLPPAPKVPEQ